MILGGALGTMGGLYLGNKIQQMPFFAEGAANNRARAQANEYSAVKQIVAVTAGSSRMIGLNSEDVNQDENVSSDNQSQSSGAKTGNNYGLSFDFGVDADGKVNAQERVLNYATGSTTEVLVGEGSGGVPVSANKAGFFSKIEKNITEEMHLMLGIVGFTAAVGEASNVVEGQWRGANGQWYSEEWGGNGATGARASALGRARMFRGAGTAAFFANGYVNFIEGRENYIHDGGLSWNVGHNVLNVAMDATYFIKIPEVAITYFILNDVIGFDNIQRIALENEQIVQGSGIRPMGGPL